MSGEVGLTGIELEGDSVRIVHLFSETEGQGVIVQALQRLKRILMLMQVDAQLLDPGTIESLRALGGDTDPDFLSDLIADYVADAAGRIADIRRHVTAGEMEKASAAAHALRGASYNVGAHLLGELAKQVEEMCLSAGRTDMEPLVREMEKVFRRTSQAILILR
jgi:HPt (histidine-containing phosphotransfer) domain-containing protein